MIVKIIGQEPEQATMFSSGFDIKAIEPPQIVGQTYNSLEHDGMLCWRRIDYIQYKTGLRLEPSGYTHTLIHPRSSISKYNLVLANSIGLIDLDYRGEILLRFKYIWQPEDVVFLDPNKYPSFVIEVNQNKIYQKGDKIGQLVFEKAEQVVSFEQVESLEDTDRGSGGFGHTDEKN